jgi:hypothetical protein
VNDGLLASSQSQVAELVDVSGLIPHGPSRDGVSDVVAVLDHDLLGVEAGVATAVGARGVEIHLIDVNSGGRCLSRCGDQEARGSHETGD